MNAHSSPITTVDLCPKNGLMASGSYDGCAILWNQNQEYVWHFAAQDLINQVLFSHDGSMLAIASADAYVYLVRVEDGVMLQRIGPFADDVNAVAWYPDHQKIACVMDAGDREVKIFDTTSCLQVATLVGHQKGIFAVTYSPDGHFLATAAEDGTGRIWDVRTNRQVALLEHPCDPETIAWSSSENRVITGADDSVLRVWDPMSGKLLAQSCAATAAVRLVRYSDDGKTILSGSYDGHLRLLDATTLEVKEQHTSPFQWERAAAMSGNRLLIGSFAGNPVLYEDGQLISKSVMTYGINTIAVSALKQLVLVGRDDGNVLNARTGVRLYQHPSIVNTVAIDQDQRTVASGDYCGNLILFDYSTRKIIAQQVLNSGPINTIVWLPNGNLVSAGYDGRIRTWSRELILLDTIMAHHGPVKSLTYSPLTGVLIAGSSDDSISGWKGNQEQYRLDSEDMLLVNGVSAAEHAAIFASASRDLAVRVWDANSGALLHTLPRVHIKSVKAISMSPDGNCILTGSYDGTAMLWNYDSSGRWVWRRLVNHGKPGVPAVALEGEQVYTAGWNGTVGLWNRQGQHITDYPVHRF